MTVETEARVKDGARGFGLSCLSLAELARVSAVDIRVVSEDGSFDILGAQADPNGPAAFLWLEGGDVVASVLVRGLRAHEVAWPLAERLGRAVRGGCKVRCL